LCEAVKPETAHRADNVGRMSLEASTRHRVVRLAAMGVLGEHDHEVTFGDPDNFAIVYGPNGVGKTRFLEIIDALGNLRGDLLAALPFESAVIEFSDGSALAVSQETAIVPTDSDWSKTYYVDGKVGHSTQKLFRIGDEAENEPVPALIFTMVSEGKSVAAPPIPLADLTDRDSVTLSSRRDRFATNIRREYERILERTGSVAEARAFLRHMERTPGARQAIAMPEEVASFAETLDLHLIATQRLLTMDMESGSPGRKDSGLPRPTIEQYSATVRARLESDLSENSRLSQRLDSIFPRLMLERREQSDMSAETIRERLGDQSKRRARIQQITPLGIQHELPLPDGELTSAQRSVLQLYTEHAEEKLSTFADTVEKIDLLEDIVNARLYGKRLQINAENGITIIRESDGDRIQLAALSSGEQHEIILMFDLLFNVKPGGLVLIDEPEISLHIAWQKRFIPDVLQIAKLVGFQFVIATHSPQIIDDNWRFAQRLGPKAAVFDEADEDA
jgi:ABC-type lipoprotein export system ATPase subunit